MKVVIRRKDIEMTANDRQRIVDRVRLALTRFARVIRGVSVTVADENGQRGGVDKTCRLVIQLTAGTVVINEQGTAVMAAVTRAAERATRAVARLQHRAYDPRRAARVDR